MNLPNLITLSRIPLLFLIAAVLYIPFPGHAWTCLVLFVIAALTDWLDGWLARRTNTVSAFGKLMDALTDKILVVGIFVLLVVSGITPEWTLAFVLIILAREFFVTGLRLVAAARGVVLAAEKAGKLKTAAQMIAISLLFLGNALASGDPDSFTASGKFWQGIIHWCGLGLYTLAAVLTAYSGWFYTTKYSFLITDKEAPQAAKAKDEQH